MRYRYAHRHGRDRVKRLRLGILLAVIAAAVGFTIYGLSADTQHRAAVTPTPTTTAPTPPIAVPTTVPPTTVPATTTTTVPTTTTTWAPMKPTTHPIVIDGGTFTCIDGYVNLTYTVRKGDNLSNIAGWFDVMGSWEAVYDLNKTVVGNNANLIKPGELLTITVPSADIPRISPVYIADIAQ